MKKILLLATLVLGMVSCMKDQSLDANLVGDGNFVLSVALPDDATRAAGTDSAKGAVYNGVLGEYDVRYTLEVYDATGALAKEAQHTVTTGDKTKTSFELRLLPGRHYRFVVWADFVKNGVEPYYNVADLRNVTLTGTNNAMNESRDAYTAVFNTAEDGDKQVFSSASTIKMTLKRPFAKLRVVTNDINELYADLNNATVAYTTPIYTTFNALTKVAGTPVSGVTKSVYFKDAAYQYAGEPTAEGKQTLFADYIFGTETGTVQFTLDVADDVAALPQVAFNTSIPVERNHLTTIYGPVLTDFNKVTVTIDDDFAQPEHIVDVWDGVTATEPEITTNPETGEPVAVIDSGADFAWFAAYVNGAQVSTLSTRAGEVMDFVLAADIDLDNHPWTPIGSATADHGFTGNFDGNNHVIKNLNIVDTNGGYVGLFGVTEGQADSNHNMISENRVANFTLENVNIVSNGDIVAAVIAYPYYTKVENITVKGNVNIKGRDYTAGVLAYTRRCVNVNNIAVEANEGSVVEGRTTVGGIISDIQTNGGLKANYSNFAASGLTVKGSKMVGGISGIICNQTLNGAAVENVTIVCDDVRKGAISGALGGTSVITEAEVNNVAGAERLVGSTYNTGDECTVTINGVVYEYLANGSYKVDGVIVVDTNEQFQQAIKAGETSIILGNGTFDLPASLTQKAGTLTIVGSGVENTILNGAVNSNNMHPGNYANGVALVFEGLTFITANNGYNGGFGHAVSVTFRESKIVGQFYAHSNAPHYFYDCTIDPLTGYLYTYGSDCVFEGCTFAASAGKALQVYEDSATGENTVTITNCAFVAAKQATTWDGKPVTGIDINSNGAKFTVNINNCTTTGFPTGLNSNSDLWNVKDAGKAHANVYVDGVQVWFAGYDVVANGLFKKENAYLVMTGEGLVALSGMTIKGGEIVTLGADIDLAGVQFNGLNAFNPETNNTFDGQGYTVSNWTNKDGASDMGFIRNWVGPVKNVKFENCHLKTAGRSAVVAAKIYGNIENVSVNNCSIEDSYWACGIIAGLYNAGSVSNCTVTNSSVKSNGGTAAIVGVFNESAGERGLKNCSVSNTTINNTGAYGEAYSGGALVGMFNSGATFTIEGCTVSNNTLEGGYVYEKYPADESVTIIEK